MAVYCKCPYQHFLFNDIYRNGSSIIIFNTFKWSEREISVRARFQWNSAGAEQQLCAKLVCAGLPCGVQVTDNWSARVRRQFHNLVAGWPAAARSRWPPRARVRWPLSGYWLSSRHSKSLPGWRAKRQEGWRY